MSEKAGRIVATDIVVRRQGRPVLESVSMEVVSGRVVGIVGPSGAGKTTLLRVLAGIHRPDSGDVQFDGVRAPRPGSVAMLAQNPRTACNPRWRLRSVIAEPARIAGGAHSDALADAVDRVQLDTALLDRFPSQVSDGQLQRALLARILVQKPTFVLADEPVAMLDPVSARAILAVLDALTDAGAGVALVSHNRALIARRAQATITLGN